MLGAKSEVKIVAEDPTNGSHQYAQEVANKARASVEEKFGPMKQFDVVAYTSQVVAGMNYKMKVQCDVDLYFHLDIFAPLPHTGLGPEIKNIEPGKSKDDSLV